MQIARLALGMLVGGMVFAAGRSAAADPEPPKSGIHWFYWVRTEGETAGKLKPTPLTKGAKTTVPLDDSAWKCEIAIPARLPGSTTAERSRMECTQGDAVVSIATSCSSDKPGAEGSHIWLHGRSKTQSVTLGCRAY